MKLNPLAAALCGAAVAAVSVAATCSGSPSTAEVLAASRTGFGEVDSLLVRFEVTTEQDGWGTTVEGEAGYEGRSVVYTTMAYLEQGGELRFLPPDLYVQDLDGSWYVLSPWNQGLRPDEEPELALDEQMLRYDLVVEQLTDVEKLSDGEIEGETYLRYSGEIDIDNLGPGSPAGRLGSLFRGAEGTVRVRVWLHRESYLPARVVVTASSSEDGVELSTRARLDFSDYDRALSPPERPTDARPLRDLGLAEPPCIGPELAGCLQAQDQLREAASPSCGGSERRVCLAPLGQVSPSLVLHLVEYYQQQYGLTVTVLTPSAIPQELVDPLREQVDADDLIRYMGGLFPNAYADPNAVLIGLTPVDMYDRTSHFRYLFGLKRMYQDPKAAISTFRMNPEIYGQPPDEELLFSRTRKLFTKYLGLLYYGLPPSDDPRSPMYDNILGPSDLDYMQEPLPVAP